MKKIRLFSIALLVVFCLTNTAMGAFAFAPRAEEIDDGSQVVSFTDDFDSYPSDWTKTGNSVELGGGWVSKPESCGQMGTGNAALFGFNNSKLKLGTYTATHDKGINDVMKNEVGVLHDVPDGITENQAIKVSGTKSHASDVWGVKFLIHNDGKSYYVFIVGGQYSRGDKSYFANYGLYKFDNGTKTLIAEMGGTGQAPNQQGGYASSGGTTTLELSYYNGTISYNFVHKVGGLNAIVYTGCAVDPAPFATEDEDLSVELFAAGSTNQTRAVEFDNFSVKEGIPYITTGEPTNVLYAETTQAAIEDEDGVIEMQEENAVRVIESPSSAGQTFDLYLSNDKNTWGKVSGCTFDQDGRWLNTKAGKKFKYFALSFPTVPDDLKAYTDVDGIEARTVVLGKDFILKAKIGDVTDNTLFVWELNRDSATIENGVVHPIARGEVEASVSLDDVTMATGLDIIGPLDLAKKNHTVDLYIAEHKSFADEINAGIREDDNERIKAVLKNTGTIKIRDFVDIDSSKISALEGDELTRYIERIKTYGILPFATVEDVESFIAMFENEYYVGLVCNLSDSDELKGILEERNLYFKLDLENKYYLKYNKEVLGSLLHTEFLNIRDLRDTFVSTYVLTAFGKALAIEMVENVVLDCADEIGYDRAHFNANKGDDMYGALLENKHNIDSVERLKAFIDNYTKPPVKPTPQKNVTVGGGGGMGGGGTRISVDSSIVTEINQSVKPQEKTEAVAAKYKDLDQSHWAYNSIMYLSDLGIVSGTPEGYFKADDAITRAEFLKMLIEAFGDDFAGDTDALTFADVAQGDWYYSYICKAYKAGVVLGDRDGKIRPNDKITREEMAVLIYRLLDLTGKEFAQKEVGTIKDAEKIANWAIAEVTDLYSKGILTGDDLGNFNPQNNTTRAEACCVIERLLKQ